MKQSNKNLFSKRIIASIHKESEFRKTILYKKEMIKKLVSSEYPKAVITNVNVYERNNGELSFSCKISGETVYMSSLPTPLRTYCYRQLNGNIKENNGTV